MRVWGSGFWVSLLISLSVTACGGSDDPKAAKSNIKDPHGWCDLETG